MTHTLPPHRRLGRWLADAYFGPAPLAAAVLIAVAAVAYAWPAFRGHTPYGDVVAGALAWDDGDKPAEAYAMALVVGVGAAVAVGGGRTFRRLAPGGPASAVGAALNTLLLLAVAPAAWRLAAAAMQPANLLPPVRLLAALPAAVLCVAVALCRYPRGSVTADHVLSCGGATLLSAGAAAFAAVGVAVGVERLVPSRAVVAAVTAAVGPAVAAAVAAAVAGVVGCWVASPDADRFRGRLLRGLVLWQLPLPLLLFFLVPPPLIDPLHRFDEPYPTLLVAALAVAAVGCGWTVARRLRRAGGVTLASAVAAPSLVAVMVYCNCPAFCAPPTASGDFFHWGEQVLPWQQLWQFGRVPYVDFAPVHALMPFVRGGLNQLLAWHELALYRRDTANFAIALRTCRGPMGSSDVFHARIFKTLEAALAWLQAFSPVADLGAAIEAPEGTVNLGGNAIRATDPHQNAEQVEQRYRVMINELVGRMDAVP